MSQKTKKCRIKDLDLTDKRLYPRNGQSRYHIGGMVDALALGVVLPAIIICRVTRKVIDGFHRCMAHLEFFGDDAEVEVEERDFANDAERLLAAGKANSDHGLPLDRRDKAVFAANAKELGASLKAIGDALQMKPSQVSELLKDRTAIGTRKIKSNGGTKLIKENVGLKWPFRGLAGETLTEGEVAVNDRWPGVDVGKVVNDLLELLRQPRMVKVNDRLIEGLRSLRKEIGTFLAGVEAKK